VFALRGAVELARQRGWAIRMLYLRTSGDIAGDPTRVVGYGCFAIIAQLLHLESEDLEKDISLLHQLSGRGAHDAVRVLRHDAIHQARCVDHRHGPGGVGSGVVVLAGTRASATRSRTADPVAPAARRCGRPGVDIEIQAKQMTRYGRLMEKVIAEHTGQPLEKVSIFAARCENTLILIDTDSARVGSTGCRATHEFRCDGSLAGFKCNRASVGGSGHARGFASSDRRSLHLPTRIIAVRNE
jgi:ATP-dependent protease ClpP protease subunit